MHIGNSRLSAALTLLATASTLVATRADAAPPRHGGSSGGDNFTIRKDTRAKDMATLGRERMKAGDCQGALDAFDEALRTTVDPTIRRDRGICHEKLEHPYPAIDDYRAYLTAMPDAADVADIRDRLQKLQADADQSSSANASSEAGLGDYVRDTTSTGGAAQLAMPERAELGEPAKRTARNSVFIEFAGNGLGYSLNYDRMFSEHWSGRLGVGFLRLGQTATANGNQLVTGLSSNVLSVPILINYLVGEGNHKLEIGLGATVIYSSGTASFVGIDLGDQDTGAAKTSVFGTGVIGYRYAPRDGGFTFRVGFTPLVGSGGFHPLAGFSLGGIF